MTKVLVTGASGFIAKHIVRELLDKGHEVRASFRSDKRRGELEALFPGAGLEYAKLDLTEDAGWGEALDGVDVLMHTASPFPAAEPKDPQELIRPAVDGTLRALRAAQAASVTRVILTSSCAAMYKDPSRPREAQSTAANWTDPNADFVSAYEASKTLAERAAWDFVGEHPEIELTAINPGAVFGPAMDPNYGTSLELVEDLLAKKYPMLPAINLPAVDVRDVAHMHVAAISTPSSIGNRYAANAGAMYMTELAQTLSQAYPDLTIPTRKAPDIIIKLLGRVVPLIRTVALSLGCNADVDGSPAETTFGFTYIPTAEALLSSAAYLQARR